MFTVYLLLNVIAEFVANKLYVYDGKPENRSWGLDHHLVVLLSKMLFCGVLFSSLPRPYVLGLAVVGPLLSEGCKYLLIKWIARMARVDHITYKFLETFIQIGMLSLVWHNLSALA